MIAQVVLLSAALHLAAARIDFPRISLNGRRLLEMTVEELPFPQGQVQHEVGTADAIIVDGVVYDTECAAPPPFSHVHAHVRTRYRCE